MDEKTYDSHAGGGYGDGTTTGTTGRNPLYGVKTFDDKDDQINEEAQAEALRNYNPKTEEVVPAVDERINFLPHERTDQVPATGIAHVQHVAGMPVTPETEQAAAQLAQDNEVSALSDLNGGDLSASDR